MHSICANEKMKLNNLPKLDLNITNRCNFRCVHCAFDSGCTNIQEFSLEKIREILEDTKKLGGEKIDITGGEPLARDDLIEIIKLGKELGYKVFEIFLKTNLNSHYFYHYL